MRLLARLRTDSPHRHFINGVRARYEDDFPAAAVSDDQWPLDWDHVDFMNLLIRHRAVKFDFDTLQGDYWTHQGRRCSWIDWMNNQSISARKAIEGVLLNDDWEWRDGQWRKWPLVASLPSFDQPWRE